MMIPRPYQERALGAVLAARRSGHRRILLQMPTGGGKSCLAGMLIHKVLPGRVLVVAHRKELLDQFFSMLRTHFGVEAGIIRAGEPTSPLLPVQLASIATLVRRDLPPADLVLVDEAHRVPGDSYARTLAAYPQATIVGLTATPCRLDGSPLSEHFDVMVHGASYSELIESGAIVAPAVYCPESADLSGVRKVGGDFNEGDLQKVMGAAHVVGDVVEEWKEKSDGRSTVVFSCGVEHSRQLAAEFERCGVRVAHLDGSTPEVEREAILMALEIGKLDVVCNVGVLTEGWDQPRVKCCVVARPTLSLTLWMQMAGRVLRPFQDVRPVVLDHAGNTLRHGLPHEDREWSLDGKVRRKSTVAGRVCPKCYAYVDSSPCPACGHRPARVEGKKQVRTAPGRLTEVQQRIEANIAKERTADPKREFFDKQVAKARSKGWKPGAASARYKEEFGVWPPWAWSQAVKVEYEADEVWKTRRENAEKYRAWRDSQAAVSPIEATIDFSQEPTDDLPDDGIPF